MFTNSSFREMEDSNSCSYSLMVASTIFFVWQIPETKKFSILILIRYILNWDRIVKCDLNVCFYSEVYIIESYFIFWCLLHCFQMKKCSSLYQIHCASCRSFLFLSGSIEQEDFYDYISIETTLACLCLI